MNKNLTTKQIYAAWYIIVSALWLWLIWLLSTGKMDGMDILVGLWIIPVAWFGLSIYICGYFVKTLLLTGEFWKRHHFFAKFIIVLLALVLVNTFCYFAFPFLRG